MNPVGWLFMITSLTFVVGLWTWCMWKVLTRDPKSPP